jgi:hypothetical protein
MHEYTGTIATAVLFVAHKQRFLYSLSSRNRIPVIAYQFIARLSYTFSGRIGSKVRNCLYYLHEVAKCR